ncbi:MAG: hypothetical protein CRN43_04040, partial [Candidatus Nephrothrix sp. EaCA]
MSNGEYSLSLRFPPLFEKGGRNFEMHPKNRPDEFYKIPSAIGRCSSKRLPAGSNGSCCSLPYGIFTA